MKARNILVLALTGMLGASAFGQSALRMDANDRDDLSRARAEAREPIMLAKKDVAPAAGMRSKSNPMPNLATIPSPFDDPDSFGQNVKFFGSLYAGTVYIYHTCDPTILAAEVGVTLAADDKCIVHNPPTAPMNQTQYVYDPAWEYTIPKDTVANTLYVLTNNYPGYDLLTTGGAPSTTYNVNYVPVVTIVSTALNDPLAIDPSTGNPMNGQYTASLTGSDFAAGTLGQDDFRSLYRSYGAVGSRGFSRSYWRAVGLPESVINKLFSRKMSLRFGIRIRVAGAVNFGQFYYTLRMMGN